MSKKIYLTFINFSEKYELYPNHLHVQNYNGTFGKGAFKRVENKTFVDENFFLRRTNFKKKVWLESHNFYYFFSKHLKDSLIADLFARYQNNYTKENLSSWETFLYSGLFTYQDASILNYKITQRAWKFYRVARWIYAKMHRLIRIEKKISYKIKDINKYLE